jgi:hypothetical protein
MNQRVSDYLRSDSVKRSLKLGTVQHSKLEISERAIKSSKSTKALPQNDIDDSMYVETDPITVKPLVMSNNQQNNKENQPQFMVNE